MARQGRLDIDLQITPVSNTEILVTAINNDDREVCNYNTESVCSLYEGEVLCEQYVQLTSEGTDFYLTTGYASLNYKILIRRDVVEEYTPGMYYLFSKLIRR